MKGQRLGRGVADNADGPGVAYELIVPDRDDANVRALMVNEVHWRQRLDEFSAYRNRGEVTDDVVTRAKFACDVLGTVHLNLTMGICCVVVAVSASDAILGVMFYQVHAPGTFGFELLMSGKYRRYNLVPIASFNLLAIDPVNVPGSPLVVQLRGVGTALVAAAAARLLRQGVEEIYLHPLDSAAQAFWVRRGFVLTAGSLYGVQGKAAMRKLIDVCTKDPDCPVDGDFIFCGVHPRIRDHILSTRR